MPAQQTTSTRDRVASDRAGSDLRLMNRALELAAKAVGLVSPGPLVGCVVASPEGEVLGEGFYAYEQLKHAETYALEQAGERAKGATAYVSLEPHAHHGRAALYRRPDQGWYRSRGSADRRSQSQSFGKGLCALARGGIGSLGWFVEW